MNFQHHNRPPKIYPYIDNDGGQFIESCKLLSTFYAIVLLCVGEDIAF